MIKARYNQCEYDNCVYFKQNNDPTYLLLYVEDTMIAARNKVHIQKFKALLNKKFNIKKNLGEAKKILGMEITRHRDLGRLWLFQENYFLKVLERFNMTKVRLITTLLADYFKLSSKQCLQSPKEKDMSRVSYASTVESLMYDIVCTGSDLAYAISAVSWFISNPKKQYWEAMKWVI